MFIGLRFRWELKPWTEKKQAFWKICFCIFAFFMLEEVNDFRV